MKRSDEHDSETSGPRTWAEKHRIEDVLAGYVPECGTAEQIARWLPTVRQWVETSNPESGPVCRVRVLATFMFVVWCDQQGMVDPDRPERLLNDRTISTWTKRVLSAHPDWTERTKQQYRSAVRNVMQPVNPAGKRPTFYQARPDADAPTTHDEIDQLVDIAWTMSRDRRNAVLATVYGCAGAGLVASDLFATCGHDVKTDVYDRCFVDVPDTELRDARRAWVRDRYADKFLWVARDLGAAGLTFSEALNSISYINGWLPDEAPRVSTYRLRARWFVDLLEDNVPLDAIFEASGATSLTALKNYLPYVEPADFNDVADWLTGRGDDQ